MIGVVASDPLDLAERGDTGAADYRWTFTTSTHEAEAMTPEMWLRAVWEDAPTVMRVFLRFGWRVGLGLRLGPADSSHVLGWHIDASTDALVVVSARSPILSATNTLVARGDVLEWQTDVRFEHVIGRIVWFPASLLHQRIVPWSVRRSVRSRR